MPVIPLGTTVFFVAIVAVLAGLFMLAAWQAGRNLGEEPSVTWLWTIGTAGFVIVWLAATAILAARGKLSDWSTWPPPMMKLVATAGIFTIFYAFSRIGGRLAFGLSIAGLVGFQVFRMAVETRFVSPTPERRGSDTDDLCRTQLRYPHWSFGSCCGVACNSGPIADMGTVGVEHVWPWLAAEHCDDCYSVNAGAIAKCFSMNLPTHSLHTRRTSGCRCFVVQAAFFGHLLVFRKLWRPA